MDTKTLTAAQVRRMLAKSGVDMSELTISDDATVWTNVETGKSGTSVRIDGPKEARRVAFHALFERGLANAPYPGSRRVDSLIHPARLAGTEVRALGGHHHTPQHADDRGGRQKRGLPEAGGTGPHRREGR